MPLIVPGSNFERQAQRLAEKMGAGVVGVERKVFPDGEMYVRLSAGGSLSGETVVVANTMFPRQNDSLVETMLLADAALRSGAASVVLLLPYLAYARQDKTFLPGEPVSVSAVLHALARRVRLGIVVDAHNPSSLSEVGWRNVHVLDILVSRVFGGLKDPIVIAPDMGALERARVAAGAAGLPYDFLVKERDRKTGEVRLRPKEVEVEGRDVLMVDDIISTGGTIAEAAKMLRGLGARRVVVAATHGLLIGNALEKMVSAGVERVLLADTLGKRVEHPLVEYVDITDRLKDVLNEALKS